MKLMANSCPDYNTMLQYRQYLHTKMITNGHNVNAFILTRELNVVRVVGDDDKRK